MYLKYLFFYVCTSIKKHNSFLDQNQSKKLEPTSQFVALPNLLESKHLAPLFAFFSFFFMYDPVITLASSSLLQTPCFSFQSM